MNADTRSLLRVIRERPGRCHVCLQTFAEHPFLLDLDPRTPRGAKPFARMLCDGEVVNASDIGRLTA